MTQRQQVFEHPDLERDAHGVIVNSNRGAYMEFIEQRERVLRERTEREELKDQVAKLTALVEQLLKDKA